LIDDYEDRYLISPNRRRYLEEKLIKPAVRSKRQFMISRKKIYVENDVNNVSLVKIRNLKEIAADLDIDWLKVINSQLFDESKVDENEKIFIFGGAQLFKELASNLLESDKG
jgi:dihydrofolate reductase